MLLFSALGGLVWSKISWAKRYELFFTSACRSSVAKNVFNHVRKDVVGTWIFSDGYKSNDRRGCVCRRK